MRCLRKTVSLLVVAACFLAQQGCAAPKTSNVIQFNDEPKSVLTGNMAKDLQTVSGVWIGSLAANEVNYSYQEDYGLNSNYMVHLGEVVINLLSPDPYVCLPIQYDLERYPVKSPPRIDLANNTMTLDFGGPLSGISMVLRPQQRPNMRMEIRIEWEIPKGWADAQFRHYTGPYYKFSK